MPSRRSLFLAVLITLVNRWLSSHDLTPVAYILLFAWWTIVVEYFATPILRFVAKHYVAFLWGAGALLLCAFPNVIYFVLFPMSILLVLWFGHWFITGLVDVLLMFKDIWCAGRVYARRVFGAVTPS